MMFGVISWVKNYALLLLAVIALAGWLGTGIQTYRLRGLKLEMRTDLLKASEAAREKEREWQLIYKETADAKEASLRAISAEHLRDLERLRDRPAKRLPTTPENCAGASPAALSAADSIVARGWGAEFDSLRAEYAACKAAIEGLDR